MRISVQKFTYLLWDNHNENVNLFDVSKKRFGGI